MKENPGNGNRNVLMQEGLIWRRQPEDWDLSAAYSSNLRKLFWKCWIDNKSMTVWIRSKGYTYHQ
jgi:hypothetical protein